MNTIGEGNVIFNAWHNALWKFYQKDVAPSESSTFGKFITLLSMYSSSLLPQINHVLYVLLRL